jgi:hypothetical protein
MTPQRTEGEGKEPEHTHPAQTHSHDHYHVSHHHAGGIMEWQHRTYWHTHEHNHAELTHSHDYSRDEEEQHHEKEAQCSRRARNWTNTNGWSTARSDGSVRGLRTQSTAGRRRGVRVCPFRRITFECARQ